jgi:hypothetical protein
MPKKLLTIRIPDDLDAIISQIKKDTGLDKTAVVHRLLRTGLTLGIDYNNKSIIPNSATSRLKENFLNTVIEQLIDQRITEIEKRITFRITEREKRITEHLGE